VKPNSARLGRGSLGRRCGSSTTTTGALIALISDGILWASILRLARSRLCLLPLPAILLRSRPPPTALTVTVVGTDKQASLALLPPKQSAVSSTPIGIPLSADGIPKQGLARRACDHDPGVPRGPFATTRALSHALSRTRSPSRAPGHSVLIDTNTHTHLPSTHSLPSILAQPEPQSPRSHSLCPPTPPSPSPSPSHLVPAPPGLHRLFPRPNPGPASVQALPPPSQYGVIPAWPGVHPRQELFLTVLPGYWVSLTSLDVCRQRSDSAPRSRREPGPAALAPKGPPAPRLTCPLALTTPQRSRSQICALTPSPPSIPARRDRPDRLESSPPDLSIPRPATRDRARLPVPERTTAHDIQPCDGHVVGW